MMKKTIYVCTIIQLENGKIVEMENKLFSLRSKAVDYLNSSIEEYLKDDWVREWCEVYHPYDDTARIQDSDSSYDVRMIIEEKDCIF